MQQSFLKKNDGQQFLALFLTGQMYENHSWKHVRLLSTISNISTDSPKLFHALSGSQGKSNRIPSLQTL